METFLINLMVIVVLAPIGFILGTKFADSDRGKRLAERLFRDRP